MTGIRDYDAWHRIYDDPDSGMTWRLGVVRGWLRDAFDARSGPVRALSVCAGDGRDVLGVLAERPDADRVSVALLEILPSLARAARETAEGLPLAAFEVREVDAGTTDAYAGVGPADVVLLVGVFGNISEPDLWALIDTAPQLCAPGATLVWSRTRDGGDLNDAIRARFAGLGFTELDYATLDRRSRPALGVLRYDGPAVDLRPGQRVFTFLR